METVIFIGSNKSGSCREAIRAAEQLGYFTILFTDRKKFLQQRLEFPDVHQMIYMDKNANVYEQILELQKQGKVIKSIISFIDSYVYLAECLHEKFCGSSFSIDAIKKMQDKSIVRNELKGHAANPNFAVIDPGESVQQVITKSDLKYPLIVKSPISTGSKDVYLIKRERELTKLIKDFSKKQPTQPLLMEEFLEGPQLLVEVIVCNNDVFIVGIVEQDITINKKFIVTGYSYPGQLQEEQYHQLYGTISTIVRRLGIKNGACHAELRRIGDEWKLIEINPRISGGAMNRIIEIGSGVNLVKETLKLHLGHEVSLEKKHEKFVYAHYLIISRKGTLIKVTGKNRAARCPGVEEVYIKPRKGMLLQPPLSMGHRYGYIIASADSKEKAKEYAREAAKEIKFFLEPV